MEAAQFAPGQTLFLPSPHAAYEPCVVESCTGMGASAILKVHTLAQPTKSLEIPPDQLCHVCEADPLSLKGAPDMVKFANLTEGALLHNLRVRYGKDQIYSAAGAILLSVNPFKPLGGVYTKEAMAECQEADAKSLPELPPHVYVLSEMAFRGMLNEQQQQAILISGESGAGKTEAAKACVKYIVARSSSVHSASSKAEFIERCILEANPILEAFGNAKTIRNNNSSRFGKWTEIHFDASGQIRSAKSTSYLLEKSRVVEHAEGERSYHVLYQLCAGLSAKEKAVLRLPDSSSIKYLGASTKLKVAGIDDASDWKATATAFGVFQLGQQEVSSMQRILAAVLNLGNIGFDAVQIAAQDDGSRVLPSTFPSLEAVAALLEIEPEALERALTVKSVGKFPVIQVPQPPDKAAVARDSLAKALYGSLFDWMLAKINDKMNPGGGGGADARRIIGLLDIFGFEAFVRNSLEQLLINFANEKLQQHFNIYIFKMEEEECRAEGVACPQLAFADNSEVMALLEMKPTGLMSLINEEVMVPNSSDANLLSKMQERHRSSASFKALPRARGEGFIVSHYAGDVDYQILGFVDKSRDALPAELSQLLSTSKMALVKGFFGGEESACAGGGAAGERSVSRTMSFAHRGGGGGARARSGGGGARRVAAIGRQFQDSLDQLMAMLKLCSPHFVRCVKPNYALEPNNFDGAYVMRQLRQMGMVHVVKARKQGYAHRYGFDQFLGRYGYLLEGASADATMITPFFSRHLGCASPAAGSKRDVVELLAALACNTMFEAEGWALGTSKLFLKASHQQQLEIARESHMKRVITQQLTQAIQAKDLALLDKAVAAAVEVRMVGKLVDEARALLTRLREEERAAQALKDAIEERDLARLGEAIKAATTIGLSGQVVADAKSLLAILQAQAAAAAALAEALSANDTKKLEAALALADKCGLHSGQVQAAQRRLAGLAKKAELETQLAAAAASGDLHTLTTLLASASEIGLTGSAVDSANVRHNVLQEAAKLLGTLQQAIQMRDPHALRHAISRADSADARTRTVEFTAAADDAKRVLAEVESEAAAAVTVPSTPVAAAQCQPPPGSFASMALVSGSSSSSLIASGPTVWQPAEGEGGVPCRPMSARVDKLKRGTPLLKVAEGMFTRSKVTEKIVCLSEDCKQICWESGKKTVTLSDVVRISVGLETKGLQKLYSSGAMDIPAYNWFSLHTPSRSFDFGAKDGDAAEVLILWVMTLEEMLGSAVGPHRCSLSVAQQRWQQHNSAVKEWPCIECTCLNRAYTDACEVCSSPKPLVSLCPALIPLLPALKAIANTLDVRAFHMHPDASLQWFLLKALEIPLPAPLKWGIAHRQGDPSAMPFLGATAADASTFTLEHPHIAQLRIAVDKIRLEHAQGGRDLPPQQLFVAPEGSSETSLASQFGGVDLQDAYLAEASLTGGFPAAPHVHHPARMGSAPITSAVFIACMSGDVDEVRAYLEQGGHVDATYKELYGWDVGPEWRFTQPSQDVTLLNYVATWTDVIGAPAPELVQLLLEHGADPRRDDGLEKWYLPLHNAVANGAHDVVRILLHMHPDLVNETTGDGESSLHLLRLCDDAQDRMITLELLIKYRASLDAVEPYEGLTPLHSLAREGFVEVAARMVEAGASHTARNFAGRTAVEEAEEELRRAERTSNGASSATRRAKLRETIETLGMVIAALS